MGNHAASKTSETEICPRCRAAVDEEYAGEAENKTILVAYRCSSIKCGFYHYFGE